MVARIITKRWVHLLMRKMVAAVVMVNMLLFSKLLVSPGTQQRIDARQHDLAAP
jgi:hypothetical protein